MTAREFWATRSPIVDQKRNLTAQEARDFTVKAVMKQLDDDEAYLQAVQKGVQIAYQLGMFNLNQLYNSLTAEPSLLNTQTKGKAKVQIDGSLTEGL